MPFLSHATPVTAGTAAQGDLNRLFGTPAASGPAAVAALPTQSRFKLLGTVAAAHASEASSGWATIAVDNGTPRTYSVGTTLAGTDVVLKSVALRKAVLADANGRPSVTLELPALPAPATGKMPAPDMNPPPAAGVSTLPAAPPMQRRNLPEAPAMNPSATGVAPQQGLVPPPMQGGGPEGQPGAVPGNPAPAPGNVGGGNPA